MKIHFIAIGGSIMHTLAVHLKKQGHQVSGSDDKIFEPSKSILQENELLPENMGWFPEKITQDIEIIILGMHAQNDNPELLQAKNLNLKIYSYPEYIYQQSRHKQRIVVAGSHGKTTVTAMVMHVLKAQNRTFDYLLGAAPKGFSSNISITKDAPIIVLEGDEYISSTEDPSPKFLHYQHHIAVITGLAWDHINVYPSYHSYIEAFEKLIRASKKSSNVIYCKKDRVLSKLINKYKHLADVNFIPYLSHKSRIKKGLTFITSNNQNKIQLKIFGEHNLQNLNAAKNVCKQLAISEKDFYEAIASFEGAYMRMEKLAESKDFYFFRDFAHAPSKVSAALKAVHKQFPRRKLVACFELHTYSSLNRDFVQGYKNSMKPADQAVVFYNSEAAAAKQVKPYTVKDICSAFGRGDMKVFSRVAELANYMRTINWKNTNLLMMSSGDFGGLDISKLVVNLRGKS